MHAAPRVVAVAALAAVVLALAVAGVTGQTVTKTKDEPFGTDLHIREFRVPTADTPSLTLFVREKYLSTPSMSGVGLANKTVLFVAGATYPSSTSFDLELDGLSWMDYLARSGYDVFLMDKRGYGRSDRPAEMNVFPSGTCGIAGAICNTSMMANDVYTVVSFILANRVVNQINLIGWSWGTSIMSLFASRYPSLVNKLVLYSPQWLRAPNTAPTACYRTVDKASALTRWMNKVPVPQNSLIPPPWFDLWWNATIALDPIGLNNSVVRAPNGIQVDNSIYWGNGTPVYNIALLTMPVLIVHAEWDVDLPFSMTQAVWFNLTNTANKRWVEMTAGTHTIIMEKNRMQLFRAVQSFFDEPNPIALTSQSAVDYTGTQIATLQSALVQAQAQASSNSSSSSNKGAIAAAVIFGILTGILAAALVVAMKRGGRPTPAYGAGSANMYTRFEDSSS